MQEARIVLPATDNDGRCIDEAHTLAKRRLCAIAGGYTASSILGGWYDHRSGRVIEEPGIAYDVAAEVTAAPELRALAVDLMSLARQDAIYLRYPSGDVEIIEADHRKPAAAE